MKRVLIVDDDAVVCRVAGRFLRDAGFGVATAQGVGAARTRTGEAFDAIVCDVLMPDGTPTDVAALFPGVPLVTMSGFLDADVAKPFNDPKVPRSFLVAIVQARIPQEDA